MVSHSSIRLNKAIVVIIMIFVIFSQQMDFSDALELKNINQQDTSMPIRTRLTQLAPGARNRALKLLGRVPEHDHKHVRLDKMGGVYYVEEIPVFDPAEVREKRAYQKQEETNEQLQYTIPILHSRPGAPNVAYLDFDGENVSGKYWNSGTSAVFKAPPFDVDGNPSSFSSDEIARITDVWARVAEDYSPFNIDITTERPAAFGPRTIQVVITYGDATLPQGATAAGISYLGFFGSANNIYAIPSWVYHNHLLSDPKNIAEAVSHEMGHTFGLNHDGTAVTVGGDTTVTEYFSGIGSGAVGWAPIMGVGYYRSISQWSNGDYANANNKQDDVAIISGLTGFSAAPATVLVQSSSPSCSGRYYTGKSVIRSSTDVNYWTMSLSSPSQVTIKAVPWYSSWNPSNVLYNGNNLDIELSVYLATSGAEVFNSSEASPSQNSNTSAESNSTSAEIGAIEPAPEASQTQDPDTAEAAAAGIMDISTQPQTAAATSALFTSSPVGTPEASLNSVSLGTGTYSISIQGTSDSYFSSYASVGQYSISVCVVPSSVACTSGPCCDTSTGKFKTAGTICRTKNALYACDSQDVCSGDSSDCPDTFSPSTTVCRAAAGVCDSPEYCSGTSPSCPTDKVSPSAQVCRQASSLCDVPEYCDGVSVGCPADKVASLGTPCRPILGVCDRPVLCNGVTKDCPTTRSYFTGFTCRAASGGCDVAEVCTNSPDCPANAYKADGTTCTLSTGKIGVCNKGTCSTCGNGQCDTGENCSNCPDDCASNLTATNRYNRYCCVGPNTSSSISTVSTNQCGNGATATTLSRCNCPN